MNRESIDDLESKGYVHPTIHRGPIVDAYATINMKDKDAIYQRNKNISPYANFTPKEEIVKTQVQKTDVCPICDTKALYRCECTEFGDMMCKNNHVWWVQKDGRVINGDPHQIV